ncbi:MAG TPA: hypothetical protein VFZ67_09580 [Nitrososphaera sp.]
MYHLGISHISSNFFLSDLSKALRNGFHSSFSIASAILKEGIVRPIYFRATTPSVIAAAMSQSSKIKVTAKNYHKYYCGQNQPAHIC